MAFVDVIDSYEQGDSGTLTDAGGAEVNYTVTSGVANRGSDNTNDGAEIQLDGDPALQIDFDIPVTGLSLTFDRSNAGEEYLILIDGVQVDLNNPPPGMTFTFTTSIVGTNGPGTHFIGPGGGVTSSGNFDNNSLGFLTITGPVNTIGVIGVGGDSGAFDIIEIGIDSQGFDVLCFDAQTIIDTPAGGVKVAELTSGDQVLCVDGAVRRVIHTQCRKISALQLYRETRLCPIRIAAGALGHGMPRTDLLVSRQHRVLVASRIAERICGQAQVLIPAVRLVGLPGIDIDRTMTPLEYYHILLDCHDVVVANGAPAETLFLGPVSLRGLDDEAAEIDTDALAHLGLSEMAPARLMPDAKTCKKIVAAHRKHARPLLEALQTVPA